MGNIHYVGAIGVSSFLITTPAGHILLDTGFEDIVPQIHSLYPDAQMTTKMSGREVLFTAFYFPATGPR